MGELLLKYPEGCRVGIFLRREKRFFVYALLEGKEIAAHTNNTGTMLGLLRPGAPVLLSPAADPKRRLPWTVEALGQSCAGRSFWVGVNTLAPNRLLSVLFERHLLSWTKGYEILKREAVYGESRLDGCFLGKDLAPLWVECKNVTLVEDCAASFPDAVTGRGAKHLQTLMKLKGEGYRAAMLYVVQRPDGLCFRTADYIDPVYAETLADAVKKGVEVYIIVVHVEKEGIYYGGRLEYRK